MADSDEYQHTLNSLWDAAYNGDIEIVRSLLSKGDERGWSNLVDELPPPVTHRHHKLPFLLDDRNMLNWDGRPALHLAVHMGREETVELLLAAGANVNLVDHTQQTCLYCAVVRRYVGLCKRLLEAGCDVNHKDKHGRSCLHYSRRPEIIEMLLDAGARIDLLDTYGCTPLYLAVRGSRDYTVRFLVEKGARLNTEGEAPVYELLNIFVSRRMHNTEADRDLKEILLEEVRSTDSERLEQYREVASRIVPEMLDRFSPGQNNPIALKVACRWVIRANLRIACQGRSITSSVAKLPLPETLKEFLRFAELT